jgi:hypothetical protein
MDRSIFICVSSFEDSVSSFVNHDLLEVCLLSQRSDLRPYPLHYKAAFAFSSLLYPLPLQPALRPGLPPRGRGIGLTLFRLNDTNDVVPACTPAAFLSVCSKCRWKQPAACLLAGA